MIIIFAGILPLRNHSLKSLNQTKALKIKESNHVT